METISLKIDKKMLHNIDSAIKNHNFSTRTEFIRDAIRDRLKTLTREELIKEFFSYAGKAKRHVSDEELRKNREDAFKELCKENGWKL